MWSLYILDAVGEGFDTGSVWASRPASSDLFMIPASHGGFETI